MLITYPFIFFFFFNDTATTEIYTLSLHDALPISASHSDSAWRNTAANCPGCTTRGNAGRSAVKRASRMTVTSVPDRKSTRLNSSHPSISYAVFCLKKKTQKKHQ